YKSTLDRAELPLRRRNGEPPGNPSSKGAVGVRRSLENTPEKALARSTGRFARWASARALPTPATPRQPPYSKRRARVRPELTASLFVGPPESWLLGGLHLVGPANDGGVGRVVQHLARFAGNVEKGLGKGVERFFAFGFRRLDHHGLGHRQ